MAMSRPKEIIDVSLANAAFDALQNLKDHRVHLRLLAIHKCGERPITEVAEFFGVGRDTISRWIRRFRLDGAQGLLDKTKGHNPSKLNDEQKQKIARWIRESKNSKGEKIHWTLEKLRAEIEKEFGVCISIMPLWKLIRNQGFRQKVPRPMHAKANENTRNEFKKNSRKK
jgi:transposase